MADTIKRTAPRALLDNHHNTSLCPPNFPAMRMRIISKRVRTAGGPVTCGKPLFKVNKLT